MDRFLNCIVPVIVLFQYHLQTLVWNPQISSELFWVYQFFLENILSGLPHRILPSFYFFLGFFFRFSICMNKHIIFRVSFSRYTCLDKFSFI